MGDVPDNPEYLEQPTLTDLEEMKRLKHALTSAPRQAMSKIISQIYRWVPPEVRQRLIEAELLVPDDEAVQPPDGRDYLRYSPHPDDTSRDYCSPIPESQDHDSQGHETVVDWEDTPEYNKYIEYKRTGVWPKSPGEMSDSDVDEGNEADKSDTARPKKLRNRYAICKNCEEAFDVTANTDKSCHRHEKRPRPREEMWESYKLELHYCGAIQLDDPRSQDLHPTWFDYPCCDKPEPCFYDWHREGKPTPNPEETIKWPSFPTPGHANS
ncbi:hypothetical protein N7532_008886 [Penicillium argentinense]|uniref:SCAN box domain-containing protein n=1 Tax=Penicillium argentinense TaxID=1131581 RepID=A0A9W9EYB2_9EURO|nr:uncharacterized protein N7532_008886 [Penicillium argentinense]KAJ5090202.1 hypothetical protein N7532_008886 [Penicillium argentinense]